MREHEVVQDERETQLSFAMPGSLGSFLVWCLLLSLRLGWPLENEPTDALATSSEKEIVIPVPLDGTGRKLLASEKKEKKKKRKKKKKKSSYNYYKPKYVSFTSSFTGNTIDDCWMGGDWRGDRMHLADCAVGFGAGAAGGRGGKVYQVTDPGDDPVQPWPGTLRYGVTRSGPLWITFSRDMNIRLKAELLITSYKTIDARGANVQIGLNGPCLTLQYVDHVIIHGLTLRDCKPSSSGRVISSVDHTGFRGGSDGDAIAIFGSSNVWIDHCSLSRAQDGLIDAIHGSTAITISNNYFSDHDKVMLLGHSDSYSADRNMKITVVYNHFVGCVQRMPRGRFGYFHVVNNNYENWDMYAIGGSANPTFFSEANRFLATGAKQVTKREAKGGSNWLWQSSGDLFVNGAYFVESGGGDASPHYSGGQYFATRSASMVTRLTANAGPLGL
ncbi:putative pectate lyase 2 [Selaginella moellendorffii]|nr:putative pectate lyase 2 [Selaginella moellendorffii]|eukprot:XP_002984442.2 putative pectate lyase 2 [Selaginella moellendorffii]